MNATIEKKNTVKLINGSFFMKVEEVYEATVLCSWYTGSVLNTTTFFLKDIIKIKD